MKCTNKGCRTCHLRLTLVGVCRRATLHDVVITKRITRDVVISLKLSMNNGDPELKTAVIKEKSVKLIIGKSRSS